MKDELIERLDEELILELTKQLVAIPTRNPPGEEKAAAEFIYETLNAWGLETELITEPDPERPQVVAWVRGIGAGPTLILNGHIDTVREGDLDAWDHSPFEPAIEGNRLYGLGACDMKSSLAVGMAVLKAVHESGEAFPGTVMFQAVMGEELAEDGTRTLLKMGYTGDYAMVLESTDLNICRATRGVVWHKLKLAGDSIHCGMADHETVDVMTQFSRFGTALADYHAEIAEKEHPLVPSPAARITKVRAGERHNHLVEECDFTVDRRMIPGETFDQVKGELEGMLRELEADALNLSWEVAYDRGNEPVITAEDSTIIELIRQNSREIRGVDPALIGSAAGTDMRNFVYDEGIPAVNYGAGSFVACNCHSPNEFVPIDDLIMSARIVMGTTVDVISLQEYPGQ